MTKKITIFILTTISAFTAFAQTAEKKVSFCNHEKTISIDELKNCGQLTCNESETKIKSYTLGVPAPVRTIATGVWDSTVVVNAFIEGPAFKDKNGYLNEDAKFILENFHQFTLQVTDIILIEDNQEKKHPPFTINVK